MPTLGARSDSRRHPDTRTLTLRLWRGKVERVLSMVDGVCLLVDATEGPMAQTKFVLTKALQCGLRPLVVLNKVDRDTSRVSEVRTPACGQLIQSTPCWEVENEIFDLFVSLDASDEQLDLDFIYASAKEGWAVRDLKEPREDMKPLLDAIVDTVPAPGCDEAGGFSMLVTMMEHDNFVGRVVTGRVETGSVGVGDRIHALAEGGEVLEVGRVTKLYTRPRRDQSLPCLGFQLR